MRILVCIDDTDNLESQGTGALASTLARHIEECGWGTASYVTRHQLLVHPDIPYTSHNSSMAFFAEISPDCLKRFTAHAADYLLHESAVGSDPGLCVVDFVCLKSEGDLIAFGGQAKERVLTKDKAYGLAQALGIHLSEHGGTGQGVIGALAGAGLRLGGNDGRLKGQLKFDTDDGSLTVAQLLKHPCVDAVRSVDGRSPSAEDKVRLHDKVKSVLLEGKSVLLVTQDVPSGDNTCWRNLGRQQLKCY